MSGSLETPLIANVDDGGDELQHYDANEEDGGEPDTRKPADDKPGLFVWLLTFAAGISGLLFGCTTVSHLEFEQS